jgi:hypothetical protein
MTLKLIALFVTMAGVEDYKLCTFIFESRQEAKETLNIMFAELRLFGMHINIGRNGVRLLRRRRCSYLI